MKMQNKIEVEFNKDKKDGEIDKDDEHRIQVIWFEQRLVAEVLCDRHEPTKLN